MRFITKLINTSKVFTIVDIGTYKIRCNIVEIREDKVKILGYGEKKQESEDFYFGEMVSIEKISKNLDIAIKKAEHEAKEKTKKIIINSGTFNVFFSREDLSIIREPGKPIKKTELKGILKKLLFDLKTKDRPLQSGIYWTKNMKFILGNIAKVSIDDKIVYDLYLKDGERIKFLMNQFFMDLGKYEILKKIAESVEKNLELIMPYESSIKDLVNELSDKKNYVVVNIGNKKTTIIVVINGDIHGINYFNIGIGELIEEVSKKYKITNIKAIKTIDLEDTYMKEKEDFYNIWEKAFKISIEDIVLAEVCPNNFFVFGGGYNEFIKNSIKQISFDDSVIKIKGPVNLQKIDKIKLDFITGKFQLDVKANMSLISMIISTKKYFNGTKNEMISLLQGLIQKK